MVLEGSADSDREVTMCAGLAGKGSDAALAALFRVADSKIDHIWLSNDVPKAGAYTGPRYAHLFDQFVPAVVLR